VYHLYLNELYVNISISLTRWIFYSSYCIWYRLIFVRKNLSSFRNRWHRWKSWANVKSDTRYKVF